jgi:hypothetical protein
MNFDILKRYDVILNEIDAHLDDLVNIINDLKLIDPDKTIDSILPKLPTKYKDISKHFYESMKKFKMNSNTTVIGSKDDFKEVSILKVIVDNGILKISELDIEVMLLKELNIDYIFEMYQFVRNDMFVLSNYCEIIKNLINELDEVYHHYDLHNLE